MHDPKVPRKGPGKVSNDEHGKDLADIFRSIDEEDANEKLAPDEPPVPGARPAQD